MNECEKYQYVRARHTLRLFGKLVCGLAAPVTRSTFSAGLYIVPDTLLVHLTCFSLLQTVKITTQLVATNGLCVIEGSYRSVSELLRTQGVARPVLLAARTALTYVS